MKSVPFEVVDGYSCDGCGACFDGLELTDFEVAVSVERGSTRIEKICPYCYETKMGAVVDKRRPPTTREILEALNLLEHRIVNKLTKG